jgi:hypothetical protein
VLGDTATGSVIMDECNNGSNATCVTGVIIHVLSFARSPTVMGLFSIPNVASARFGKGTGIGSIETRLR